ncbi:hypothetical protein WJX73_010154 [Symbiochloris irregularis]|uniref:Uncharacterized protein n=1 Tax=Symbiochloris irregularis TaxID=706552 RepID=A0AAW1NNG7_9CHLO
MYTLVFVLGESHNLLSVAPCQRRASIISATHPLAQRSLRLEPSNCPRRSVRHMDLVCHLGYCTAAA